MLFPYITQRGNHFDKFPVSNGAEGLFNILDDGIKADMERMKRVLAGKNAPGRHRVSRSIT